MTWNSGVLGLQVWMWHPVQEEAVGFKFFITCVCSCVHVCRWMHVMEDVDDRGQLSESVLPFHHMNPKDWIQVIRLSIKCLYPLSLLTDTIFHFLKICFILNRMYLLGQLHMNMYMWMLVSKGVKAGISCPAAGVPGSCKSLDMGSGNRTQTHCESSTLNILLSPDCVVFVLFAF